MSRSIYSNLSFIPLIFLVGGSAVYAATDSPETPINIPNFKPVATSPGKILPVIRVAQNNGYVSNSSFVLRKLSFLGNTIFSDARLIETVEAYLNKNVSPGDLYSIRDRITQFYIDNGYVNSGAILPSQTVIDGELKLSIVEGRLSKISVKSDGRLNQGYLRYPLRKATSSTVNIYTLENRLQQLRQDARIKSVAARLEPTALRGEAVLAIDVQENTPYDFSIELNNHYSPNIGAEGVRLAAQHDNLSGIGNQLYFQIDKTLGYTKGSLRYGQRFYAQTYLDLQLNASQSRVIDEQFESLDIEDQSQSLSIGFRRPLVDRLQRYGDWSVSGFYRHGTTFLLGEPFSFAPGRIDGQVNVQGLRIASDWRFNSAHHVVGFGMSSTFSVSLPEDDDDDGAGIKSTNAPDGQAVIIGAHAQWARKLALLNSRIYARFNSQFSSAPLYGVQQFALGGSASVRAYRENLVVRDNGILGSLELQVPVWTKSGTRISLAAFADGGSAWQTDRPNDGPRVLASTGGGLVGTIVHKTRFRLYYGRALRQRAIVGTSNWQDDGLHFSVRSHWR